MAKVLMKVGGVAGAGSFIVEDNSGNVEVKIDGTKVLDSQQSAIADAVTSHGAATTAELDALGTKINAIIAALEAHGLIAS